MHCEEQIWGICLVIPAAGGDHSIFTFADFIAALALMVIVYTLSDVRYRFRLAIAPTVVHLFFETFVMIGIIGFGILLTDVWVAEHWLVPESLITAPIWRGMFAAMFLSLAMTWMWYAFIRPPIFGRKNYNRYYNALYYLVVKGSDEELPIIASELGRSARSLVKYARADIPSWASQIPGQQGETTPSKERKPDVSDYAHDVLLLIGNRKLCREIVESSPVTAIQFFEEGALQRRANLPFGQFARNISSEAILNIDSILYHEDEGFSAGLTGYLKTFSRAVYGNYALVEELGSRFGSPLDIRLGLRFKWNADHVEAYCRAILLTFEDYLKGGHWGQQSYVLNRAFSNVGDATGDLHLLDKTESYYSSDISKRLTATVKFLQSIVELLDKTIPFPEASLKTKDKYAAGTFYDTIADVMFEIIFDASAVNSPFFTSWNIQYGAVWSELFGTTERTRAWKIIQFKLRRLLYDEVREMDRTTPNFKSARILGFCLNVMGLIPGTEKGAFEREHRALHRALLVWTQRNYLRMHRESPKVAEACLIGSISFDANRNILVKTYAQGLSREPVREYLSLMEPPRSEQK
jgi:hypothetical protein